MVKGERGTGTYYANRLVHRVIHRYKLRKDYFSFRMIDLVDVLLFVVGIVFGIVFGFYTGRLIFRQFFKKYEKAITFESAAKFGGVQQIVNYGFGFALATMPLDPTLSVAFMAVWLAFQTWLALRIFGFPKPIHGLTYSALDTGADLIMGVTFGTGAATFTLVRMSLMGF